MIPVKVIMLREIKNPKKQYPEEGFRRWFTDDYFDLITMVSR